MFAYSDTTVVFYWVLAFYFLPLFLGFILGNLKLVSLAKISEIGQRFGDPLTVRLHKWSRRYKLLSLKNRNWFNLFILIFLNNLILAAFITRIVYGIIFIIPLFLTAWSGFGHGVIFSKPKGRGGIVLIILEYGGYLLATVIGVKIGLNLFLSLIKGIKPVIAIPWNFALLTVVFLFLGAALESISMIAASKHMDLSDIENVDLDKSRRDLAKMLDEE